MYKMKKHLFIIGLTIILVGCSTKVHKTEITQSILIKEKKMDKTIYDFHYQTPNDETKSFEKLSGKVILIVNTATQCGLTPQFEGLEKLHKTYSKKGLVVLGFPCNQFGGQEPLSDKEMVATCMKNHGVTFELTKKIEVNGERENPLYGFLKTEQKIKGRNNIRWNFEKFLVNRKGEVVKRFSPRTTPAEITAEIEGLL
ncbi:MAG: glutathione peroxidase [Flavobacteriales bacterium]|jgi:glutathione peroxidase|tara:strand:+ start:292 stop:888 length:597 start_codon:yes stop_codon:yes gene_type:complete